VAAIVPVPVAVVTPPPPHEEMHPVAPTPKPPNAPVPPVTLKAPPPRDPLFPDDSLPPVPPTHRPLSLPKLGGWVGIGVGGAALVAAVALGVTVNNDKAALAKPSETRTTAGVDEQLTSIASRATGANVLYGIGGVLAAAGMVAVIVF
jgi:hypothetical protein